MYVNLLRRGSFFKISGKFNECLLIASINRKHWLHTLLCGFLDFLVEMLD